jgi:hypothetical protein
MTVHSPPSTSLGTSRSDDSMELDLLEVIKSSRKVLVVHSPPSTSLGTRRSDDDVKSCHIALSFRRIFPRRFWNVPEIPSVDLCPELWNALTVPEGVYSRPTGLYSPPSMSLGTRRDGL